jgi:hypothetical protein
METKPRIIEVELSDGSRVKVEATPVGEQQIAVQARPFREVISTIETISNELSETLQKVRPTKASVKFGLEIAVEAGKLTTLIVQGSGKANLEITLEWDKDSS